MEFFEIIAQYAENLWFFGGVFILVLSTLVFVHEWGHYYVARLCGVKVEIFSIGFGPEIWGINDKNGTRWKFSLIPLGGYVKMFGDTDPASASNTDNVKEGEEVRPMTDSERKEAFFSQAVWKRAAVVFAGPAINFLFAIVIFAGLYGFYGQPVTPPMASAIIVDSAADKAGFEPHDKIISIDGRNIKRFEDIRRIVTVSLDKPLSVVIDRNGTEEVLNVTPERLVMTDRFGFSHSRGMLGIIGPGQGIAVDNIIAVNGRPVDNSKSRRQALINAMDKPSIIQLDRGEEIDALKINALSALNNGIIDNDTEKSKGLVVADRADSTVIKHGVIGGVVAASEETWRLTNATLTSIGQIFTGMRSAKELGGIIRIGAITGDMAQQGIIAVVTLMALLSINLGLINLFPVPMLDGGHLVFYAIEAAKGSPVPEKAQEYAFRVGFVLLIGLMLFANINDIIQLVM